MQKEKRETFAKSYVKDGKISEDQWNRLTDLFNRFRITNIDSGTIIDIFQADEKYDIFETADDLIKYIEENGEGVYRRQLGQMKRSNTQYRYDLEKGKFVRVEDKKYTQLQFDI